MSLVLLNKGEFQPITVGDVRPIIVRVKPSDETATVQSATYSIIRREDDPAAPPFDPGGACIVKPLRCGASLATPQYIAFPKPGNYVVRYSIVWSDGQIDNTVSALIPVCPLSS